MSRAEMKCFKKKTCPKSIKFIQLIKYLPSFNVNPILKYDIIVTILE